MNKRKSMKLYLYIMYAMIVLTASWDAGATNAAVVEQEIPQESIRLRILANSDSPRDQWVKRQVRDAVIAHMNGWIKGSDGPEGIEEARMLVREHLGDFETVVGGVLRQYGFSYPYTVELGIVPFPTKVYGSKIYPADDYEALRITLGSGEGQNWWCVLFPPLCFVEIASADAEDKRIAGVAAAADGVNANEQADGAQSEEQAEVRFLVWDMLSGCGSFLKGLFS